VTTPLAVGDILEISCDGSFAYASYAGKHSWLGEAIWLIAKPLAAPPASWEALFGEAGYFVFFAVQTAIRHKHMRRAGFALEAMHPVPVLVRTVVNKDASGKVLSWLITDGAALREPRRSSELTAAERQLPIGSIWNYKFLCERIAEQWNPERLIGDTAR
jgi:hypothetical protein